MFSKSSFKLLVVSNTTPFFAVVQIIYFHDCLRIYTFIFLTPWQGLENGSFRILAEKRVVLTYSRTFTKIFVFFPWKSKFWNVDNIEHWKRFDFTQKMAKKLKIFTLSHRKVLLLEIELKVLDIWTTLPPEIHHKIFFRQSENLYFHISDPLTRFRNGSFRILAEKRVVLTYSRTFTKIFVFFPWKSKFWNVDNIEHWKRFDFTQKMAKKLKIFTLSHRKVLLLEIELKILDIWTTLPPEINHNFFSDNHGNKLLDKRQNLRESSIS